MPSITSTSTTSPSSFSTAYWAIEAPTLPAPTTVIFGRAMFVLLAPYSAFMLSMTAVPKAEHLTSFAPSMSRAKSYVTIFCAMVFSMPALMRSAASVQPMWRSIISPERMTEPGLTLSCPTYLGAVPRVASTSACVKNENARQIAARDDVDLVWAGQNLLEECVGDGVLDEDLPRRRLASTV